MTGTIEWLSPDTHFFKNLPPYFAWVRIPESLDRSISRYGILQPVGVVCRSTGLCLVDGWKRARFAALHHLALPVYTIPVSDSSDSDWAQIRIELNQNGKSLSPLERIFILESEAMNQESLWFKQLQISFKPGTRAFIRRISTMPPPIWEALESETIRVENLDHWNCFSDHEIVTMVECLTMVRFNLNQERQFISDLHHLRILRRDELDVIMQELDIRSILTDETLSPPKRIERCLAAVNNQIRPHITAFRNSAEQMVRKLNLPRNVVLQPKDQAEENQWCSQFIFDSPSEFDQQLHRMSEIARNPEFTDLFGIVKGNR